MSKVWKWILGVLAALVIIGVVAAAVFVWWNHAPITLRRTAVQPPASGTPAPNAPNSQRLPTNPYGFDNDRRFQPYNWGWRMPMMRNRLYPRTGAWMPFGFGLFFLGGLLRLIIPLGILALVAFLFYQLGKRAALRPQAAPPAPPTPPQDRTPLPGRKVAKS